MIGVITTTMVDVILCSYYSVTIFTYTAPLCWWYERIYHFVRSYTWLKPTYESQNGMIAQLPNGKVILFIRLTYVTPKLNPPLLPGSSNPAQWFHCNNRCNTFSQWWTSCSLFVKHKTFCRRIKHLYSSHFKSILQNYSSILDHSLILKSLISNVSV